MQDTLHRDSLIDTDTPLIFRVTATGQALDMPGWLRFTGQTTDAAAGTGYLLALHPDDRAMLAQQWKHGDPFDLEVRVRRRDGDDHLLRLRGVPIREVAGNVQEWVCVATDESERLRWEQVARESETRFRILADTAPVLMWMSEPDTLCSFFNEVWLRFTGRTLEQEMGNGWAEGVHPDDFDRCLEIYLTAFQARQPFEMEYRLRHHDGQYRWIVDRGAPRYSPEGVFAGYIGSCIDITGRKAQAEQTREVLEALLQMARLLVAQPDDTTVSAQVEQQLVAMA
ncbi:MAG TPA: PAS domain-containing protein, partial [Ktedonobacterales bacterium]|nr:PAS domain-containing protein [Ktedonobacterales bacterium]